jgi:H+/Cl- antiporter ClcA
MVLKMIATAATHGSGAVGGAFTPTLFVGALLGVLFGMAVHALAPAWTGAPSAYAVIGMGAMLAATTHAPMMSILMIFEMTLDYGLILPLMLGVVTAHYTARRHTDVKPMYAESLLPREVDGGR